MQKLSEKFFIQFLQLKYSHQDVTAAKRKDAEKEAQDYRDDAMLDKLEESATNVKDGGRGL